MVTLQFVESITITPGSFLYDPPNTDRVKISHNFTKDLFIKAVVANNILVDKYIGRYFIFLPTETNGNILLFTKTAYSGELLTHLPFPSEYKGLTLLIYFLVREYNSPTTFSFYTLVPTIIENTVNVPVAATAGDIVGQVNIVGFEEEESLSYSILNNTDIDGDNIPAFSITNTGQIIVEDIDDIASITDISISVSDIEGNTDTGTIAFD